MSILINSYASTGVLLHAALLPLSDDKKAVALDGVRLSFLVLDEASHRLNECLTEISNGSLSVKDGVSYYMRLDHILGYVWTIIDNSRRVLRFIKILDFSFNTAPNNYIADTIDLLTKARDSYQHLDERIKQYYSSNHGSLNGDLSWYFREANSTELTSCFLSSAASSRPAQSVDGVRIGSTEPHLIEYKQGEEIGVFGLSLHFIKSENKEKGPFTYSVLSIDKIVEAMNNIIIVLLQTYNPYVEDKIGVKGKYDLPFLSRITIDKTEK